MFQCNNDALHNSVLANVSGSKASKNKNDSIMLLFVNTVILSVIFFWMPFLSKNTKFI